MNLSQAGDFGLSKEKKSVGTIILKSCSPEGQSIAVPRSRALLSAVVRDALEANTNAFDDGFEESQGSVEIPLFAVDEQTLHKLFGDNGYASLYETLLKDENPAFCEAFFVDRFKQEDSSSLLKLLLAANYLNWQEFFVMVSDYCLSASSLLFVKETDSLDADSITGTSDAATEEKVTGSTEVSRPWVPLLPWRFFSNDGSLEVSRDVLATIFSETNNQRIVYIEHIPTPEDTEGRLSRITSLALSPDGEKLLIGTANGCLQEIGGASHRQTRLIKQTPEPNSLLGAYSTNGTIMYQAAQDQELQVVPPLQESSHEQTADFCCNQASLDSTAQVACPAAMSSQSCFSEAKVSAIKLPKTLLRRGQSLSENGALPQNRFVKVSDKYICAGTGQGKVFLIDQETRAVKTIGTRDTQAIIDVAIGEGYCAGLSQNGCIRVWNINTKTPKLLNSYEFASPATTLIFYPGFDDIFISGHEDGTIGLICLTEQESYENLLLRAGGPAIRAMSFASAAKLIWIGYENGSVECISLHQDENDIHESGVGYMTRAVLRDDENEMPLPARGPVKALATSSDGRKLAVVYGESGDRIKVINTCFDLNNAKKWLATIPTRSTTTSSSSITSSRKRNLPGSEEDLFEAKRSRHR